MDVRAVLAAQTEMYGEPLGQRIGRLLAAYQVSQARLAAVLGLSPPMLSQLMSGQRAKISNPAVLGRLVRPAPPGTATTAPPPAVPATAGDPCGWQQEGDLATATDGRTVVCVQVGADYRWRLT